MKPGESLLVHAGTGGVGQAAISIALHMGCTVYTTVGSAEKREYLKKNFPQVRFLYVYVFLRCHIDSALRDPNCYNPVAVVD